MFALRTPRIAGLVVTRSSRFKQNYAMDHGPWDVRRPPASPCRAAVLVGQRRAGCFAEFKKLLHLAADLCHSDEWQLMARCALHLLRRCQPRVHGVISRSGCLCHQGGI